MNGYKITLSFLSNIHIGSGFGFAGLIDHKSIEDAEGLAYIPGSTLKGKLRSLCKKIALTLGDKPYLNKKGKICQSLEPNLGETGICKYNEPGERCIICSLFGSRYAEGKLTFTDLRLNEELAEKVRTLSLINPFIVKAQNELRTNVKLLRTRRLSDPGHLFVSKNVSKALTFSGTIYTTDNLTPEEADLLKYGVNALTHLGGQKARGLGRIKEARLEALAHE